MPELASLKALESIRLITAAIRDPDRSLDSYMVEISQLSRILRKLCPLKKLRKLDQATTLPTGVAIAPYRAATCLEDQVRTVAFLRGSMSAIEQALANDKKPLHLLEAGCGPLGTLAIPLLAHFSAEKVQLSLVDIHQESIDSVLIMIEILGLSEGIRQAMCGDAAEVLLETCDFILTETMEKGLYREPQVPLTRTLMARHPGAILLPSRITINLALLNFFRETRGAELGAQDRVQLGTVFELTAQSSQLPVKSGCLAAETLRIPDVVADEFGLFLLTSVEVFGGASFADYESLITFPTPLVGRHMELGDHLDFRYRLQPCGLEYRVL